MWWACHVHVSRMFVITCHVYCSISWMVMIMAMMMTAVCRQHYSLTTTTDWYIWHCHTLPGQPVVGQGRCRRPGSSRPGSGSNQPLVVLAWCSGIVPSHHTLCQGGQSLVWSTDISLASIFTTFIIFLLSLW